MGSYLEDVVASLEKRRREIQEQIQPQLDELDELDAVLERLRAGSSSTGSRRPTTVRPDTATARRDTAKEIHALLADSPHGLKASEISKKAGLSMQTVYSRLREMTERGEVTKESGRYAAKSVVPGAERGKKTVSPDGLPPDVAPAA